MNVSPCPFSRFREQKKKKTMTCVSFPVACTLCIIVSHFSSLRESVVDAQAPCASTSARFLRSAAVTQFGQNNSLVHKQLHFTLLFLRSKFVDMSMKSAPLRHVGDFFALAIVQITTTSLTWKKMTIMTHVQSSSHDRKCVWHPVGDVLVPTLAILIRNVFWKTSLPSKTVCKLSHPLRPFFVSISNGTVSPHRRRCIRCH